MASADSASLSRLPRLVRCVPTSPAGGSRLALRHPGQCQPLGLQVRPYGSPYFLISTLTLSDGLRTDAQPIVDPLAVEARTGARFAALSGS